MMISRDKSLDDILLWLFGCAVVLASILFCAGCGAATGGRRAPEIFSPGKPEAEDKTEEHYFNREEFAEHINAF